MACQPTFSNWDSLPAGREKCSAGASPEPNGPAGAPSSPSCPQIRHWYENDVTRLRVCLNDAAPALVVPAPQFVIPAKAGIHALTSRGRTSTAIPSPTSTRRPPLRLSGESTPQTPIRRRNPEGCGQCQFSYLGVPAPAGMRDCYESMSRTPIRDRPLRARLSPLIS